MLPRSAYIHVPFCRHRCGYCNFTLVAGRQDLVGDYLRAIELELARLGIPRDVDTLYYGGGTPTFLTPEQLSRLTQTVLQWHPLASGYEWTVEANPADVNEAMVGTLTECGVTRLSLGAQSFHQQKLRLLERDHEPDDVKRAMKLARDNGMQVAIDLIFATSGETLNQWHADMEGALAIEPDHVSVYGLTFERGSAFWGRRKRGELVEVDEELQREMYALAIDRLTAAGFEHYEISNFARPGRRSRHNETYWSGAGYYAAGPGAARYVAGIRETNHRSTTTYLHRVLAGDSPVAEREQLNPEARARELLVFGLRRMEGVARHDFNDQTGFQIDALVAAPLKKFMAAGLLADDGEHIRLTRHGLFVSDALWPEML
ncbi:MAG: radical SAM family heme chaperone HemW [Planctomycetes bacterium]|nr:radical SAM family heme chaperone HemW [Planctomycetota bacterium]